MGKYDQYDPKVREVMELLDQKAREEGANLDAEELEKEKEAGRQAAQRLLEKAEEEAGQDAVNVEYSMMMSFYENLLADYQRREEEEKAGGQGDDAGQGE